MSIYTIEQRIRTTAENAVFSEQQPSSFTCGNIKFSHDSFNYRDGWLDDFWMSLFETDGSSFMEAYSKFLRKLNIIIPRISLIGQCYINFINESFLVRKKESHLGFLCLAVNRKHVGLMFQENEKHFLDILLETEVIPESFYRYWNDATNTANYSSKVLVMFSAIESLAKKSNGTKDWNLINDIFGETLADTFYKRITGLRHRLIHGEYFGSSDSENYAEIIHRKIISYFNRKFGGKYRINEDVISPQRNFYENKEGGNWLIEKTNKDANFDLKSILAQLDLDNLSFRKDYDFVFDNNIMRTF